jgi:hypothetical protein
VRPRFRRLAVVISSGDEGERGLAPKGQENG